MCRVIIIFAFSDGPLNNPRCEEALYGLFGELSIFPSWGDRKAAMFSAFFLAQNF